MAEIWEEYKIVIINDRKGFYDEMDMLEWTNEFEYELKHLVQKYSTPDLLGMTIQLSNSEVEDMIND